MIKYYKNLSLESLFYINEDGLVCQEEWRNIIGFENRYQISSLGRVKSLGRRIKSGKKNKNIKEAILKQSKTKNGYYFVSIRKFKVINAISCRINRLVGIHFIPNPENKPEVNHKDGIKSNNTIENLEWNTRSENAQHAYDNKLINPNLGEKHQMSKLTEKQVLEIRKIHAEANVFYKKTALKYNITPSMVGCIVRRDNWTHI